MPPSSLTTPNPGSLAARELGCKCPVRENNNGRWPSYRGGWVIFSTCPVHYPADLLPEMLPVMIPAGIIGR